LARLSSYARQALYGGPTPCLDIAFVEVGIPIEVRRSPPGGMKMMKGIIGEGPRNDIMIKPGVARDGFSWWM
jgi:hypothetical protein